MTVSKRATLVIAAIVLVFMAGWVSAQVGRPPSMIQQNEMDLVAPAVISGSDLGFRLESTTPGSVPVGRLVVRINGVWVDAQVGTSGVVRE